MRPQDITGYKLVGWDEKKWLASDHVTEERGFAAQLGLPMVHYAYNHTRREYARSDKPTIEGDEMGEDNRWAPFSDEELQTILTGVEERDDQHSLVNETDAELKRRREERAEEMRPTYRGPGFYTDVVSGSVLKVVGKVTIYQASRLLVGESMEDPNLWALSMEEIEARQADGTRRFRYSETQP